MKVGDRVVCVKAHSDPKCPLIVGREYIIYGLKKCKCTTTIDVGLISTGVCGCSICQTILSVKGAWYLDQSLFRKVEEKVNYVKLEVEIKEPCLN